MTFQTKFLGTLRTFAKIHVNSAGFSLLSRSRCDICQLEVHDVKVYPQYHRLYQPVLYVLPKLLNKLTFPEEVDQGFCVSFTEGTGVR